MPKEIARTVNGVSHGRAEYVRLLCTTIDKIRGDIPEEEFVGARVDDIIQMWGDPAHDTPDGRRILAQDLFRLSTRQNRALDPISRGRYVVHPNYRRQGNNRFEATEKTVIPWLIDNGGFMSHTAIRERLGLKARLGTLRKPKSNLSHTPKPASIDRSEEGLAAIHATDSEDTDLRFVLSRSQIIRSDFPVRNLWNLSFPLLDAIPLEGRWAKVMIEHAVAQVCMLRKKADAHEASDLPRLGAQETHTYFKQVGATFRRLRQDYHNVSTAALFRDPILRKAVEATAAQHEGRFGFLDYLEQRGNPLRSKAIDNYPPAYHDAEGEDDWAKVVLWMFEDGDYETHLTVRTPFYKAFAAHFWVDAPALSRGMIRRLPSVDAPLHQLEQLPEGPDRG